jgi:hypothetical protein
VSNKPPQTPLGKKISNGTAKPSDSKVTPLSRAMPGGSRGEDVVLPLLGRVRIELVGETAKQEIEAAVYRAMRARELDLNIVTSERYEAERAVRTLAHACRDPDDATHTAPFGTLEQWGELDSDIIATAWQAYGDVRERLDPLETVLTEDERIAIEVAVKKKDARLLRSYGISKLSSWLASMDVPPSTSQPPSSPNSGSDADSSG